MARGPDKKTAAGKPKPGEGDALEGAAELAATPAAGDRQEPGPRGDASDRWRLPPHLRFRVYSLGGATCRRCCRTKWAASRPGRSRRSPCCGW